MAEPEPTGRGVALMLAGVAVVAAVLGARASLVSSDATGTLDQAIRQQVKRAAALVEDVRFVYTVEGTHAFTVAAARIRAEEFRRAAAGASGQVRDALLVEADAAAALVDTLEPAFDITATDEYRTEDGGYDVARRLADERATNPDLVTIDPDATQARGNRLADRAFLDVAATIPVSMAFLFGALAQGFPSRRRPLVAVGLVLLAAGILAGIVIEVG